MERGTAPEDVDDSFATGLQEVIADEVKSRFENALASIPDMGEKLLMNVSAQAPLMLRQKYVP